GSSMALIIAAASDVAGAGVKKSDAVLVKPVGVGSSGLTEAGFNPMVGAVGIRGKLKWIHCRPPFDGLTSPPKKVHGQSNDESLTITVTRVSLDADKFVVMNVLTAFAKALLGGFGTEPNSAARPGWTPKGAPDV